MQFHPKGLIVVALLVAIALAVGTVNAVAAFRVVLFVVLAGVLAEGLALMLSGSGEGIGTLLHRLFKGSNDPPKNL